MFGLLNPFALWFIPLLAAPLVIHFLGRSQPTLKDFPSLLPVRGQLTQAMRRHKLKNWLQLLLRTLAILFLLLAAANLLWRPRHGFAPPVATGLLIHNGAYGAIPLAKTKDKTVLQDLEGMQRGLDSLTLGHGHVEFVLPDASNRISSARFGRYSDALSKLLKEAHGQSPVHIHLPVFDWSDMEESRPLLIKALTENPGLRVVLTEYPEASGHLAPFTHWSLNFPKENIASLKTRFSSSNPASGEVFWTPSGGSPRAISTAKDSIELQVPFSQPGWIRGELSLPPPQGDGFAYPAAAIIARIPPPLTLCHVGNAFASLASLGRGGLRLQIKSFADSHGPGSEPCDFLYLADPKEMDAGLVGRAAEIARGGGKVILGLGSNTDMALLNRSLLEPLDIGRLTQLKRQDAAAVQVHAAAFASLGMHVGTWGDPGKVTTHLALSPGAKATVLLSSGTDPILIYCKTGRGSLLLWTTDINDREWTDLGLGPWPALIHPAFVSGSSMVHSGLQWVASDSTFLLASGESDELRVTDETGTTFSRTQRDPDGWRIGPFDHLGIYRLELHRDKGADTSWLAVGLAENRLQTEEGSKGRFMEGLGESRSQVLVREADADWRTLYGGFRLRLPLLILAALLLFLEGVVSLRLRPAPISAARD